MSEEESKKLFRKRKIHEIENDDEDIIQNSNDSKKSAESKNSNLKTLEIRKRMLKSRSNDRDTLIKSNRKSTLTNQQLEKCWEDDIFTDEITDKSSEYSYESEEANNNFLELTSRFRIVPSEADGNCLFHTLNNIVFGSNLTAKNIREEICDFLIKKKEIYRHIWEGDIDRHVANMRREGYWGTNLELLAFSDLMRLNINIYTSLDQEEPEFQINHPQNEGEINIFLRNWRHYEGLQLLDEQNEFQVLNLVDIKNLNDDLLSPPQSMKQNKIMDNNMFVKENQKMNKYPKNASAHNLADEYYQEIYDYLTKKPGERFPKRLEVNKNKENWKNILEDRKKEFSKKLKLQPSKKQKFKAIKKFLIYKDPNDNKEYFLTLRTYTAEDSELDVIKANENTTVYDKFIIQESRGNKSLIGYYRILPTIDEIPKMLNEAHAWIKSHLNYRNTADYIQNTLHWYWPNIFSDCEDFVNKCIKCRMHKTHKKKRIVKFIRTKRPYERYQVDLVEISKELNMKDKFPYILTCIDHFSKYAWAIPIKNKEAITVRNAIANVFIQGHPEIIQSDNGKEFTNKILDEYLFGINVTHIYGSPYHPQSQGAIEAFNKTVQKALSAAYDNLISEKVNWDLELNLFHFLHFYNWKRKHTTTQQIPKHVLDNFNNEKIREIVMIATEKSRKEHLENSLYKEDDEVMITNWIQKINPKKQYYKREKPKKGSKHERHERYDIKGKVTKIKHQVCYVVITEVINSRDDIKVGEEIRVTYDCILKIT